MKSQSVNTREIQIMDGGIDRNKSKTCKINIINSRKA